MKTQTLCGRANLSKATFNVIFFFFFFFKKGGILKLIEFVFPSIDGLIFLSSTFNLVHSDHYR